MCCNEGIVSNGDSTIFEQVLFFDLVSIVRFVENLVLDWGTGYSVAKKFKFVWVKFHVVDFGPDIDSVQVFLEISHISLSATILFPTRVSSAKLDQNADEVLWSISPISIKKSKGPRTVVPLMSQTGLRKLLLHCDSLFTIIKERVNPSSKLSLYTKFSHFTKGNFDVNFIESFSKVQVNYIHWFSLFH